MAFSLKSFILLTITLLGLAARSECMVTNPAIGLLSDRYEHIASSSDFLFLSRGDILELRNLSADNLSPTLLVQQIPSRITGMKFESGLLWLTLEGIGILPIFTSIESPGLEQQKLISFPGIRVSDIHKNIIAVGISESLQISMLKDSIWGGTVSHEFESPIKKIKITDDFLFVLLVDGSLFQATKGPAFGSSPVTFKPIITLGGSLCYQFSWVDTPEGGRMFLDLPRGIVMADSFGDGETLSSRFILQNEGSKVVLSMSAFGNDIFMRFPESVDWYRFSENQLQFVDKLSLDLENYAMPKLMVNEDILYLLNANDLPGQWSLLSFEMGSQGFVPKHQLNTTVNKIKGFVLENNQLFLAVDQHLYRYPWDDQNTLTPEDFEIIQTFPTSILSMVAIPSGFVLSTNNLEKNGTELIFFSTLGGEASQTQKFLYERGVQDLKSNGNLLTFFETEVADEFKILNLHMLKLINGEWVEKIYTETRGIDQGFNFKDITPMNDSILFLEDSNVYTISYDSLEKSIFFESKKELIAMGRVDKTIVIESEEGILHLDPLSNSLSLGFYPDWDHLTVTRNSIAMVRSKHLTDLGMYEVLAMDERQFLYPQTRILTGIAPTHLVIQNLKLLFHTPYSFQEFDFICPSLSNQYIWPDFELLEFDLNTNFTSEDMIRWNFWDENNSLIGRYYLEADLIQRFNGRPLSEWPVALNQNSQLRKITVRTSFPLYPVLSGSPAGSGRFSVPFSGELFPEAALPHVASSSNGWENELYLQFHPFGVPGNFFINWGGLETIELKIPESGSATYIIPEQLGESISPPWLDISMAGLNTGFTGFNVFKYNDMTAGIVLEPSLSEFFVIPMIPISKGIDWQGIALSNPYTTDLHIRLLGYDELGQIILDKSDLIRPLQKMIVNLQQLSPFRESSVSWMNLITERPTSAISVIGNDESGSIAGFSLRPQFGKRLILPGIRSGTCDTTKNDLSLHKVDSSKNFQTQLMLINTESTEGISMVQAFSHSGENHETVEISFGPKETVLLCMEDLFPDWTSSQLEKLGTLVITSSTETNGVCIRKQLDTGTIEAYCLYALP